MADRASASITIGGTLARSLLHAFLAAITSDGICTDYDEAIIGEDDIVSGASLHGADHEVSGGTFTQTETFCREHGLRYIRNSDGCAGVWTPSIAIFPGSGAPMDFAANEDGAIVLTLDDIRRLGSLKAIEAHFGAAVVEPGPLIIVEDEDGSPPASAG